MDEQEWRYGAQLGPKPEPDTRLRRKVKQEPRPNPYRGNRESAAYQRKARELKGSPEGGVCWICGREIDRGLPPDQNWRPEAWTADHDPPLAQGGSLLVGLRPAHRGCNSAKGRAMQLEPAAETAAEYTPRPGGGFTTTPHLNPADRGYIEYSREW